MKKSISLILALVMVFSMAICFQTAACAEEDKPAIGFVIEQAQAAGIKVFLSAHNGLALGINNYFTGISSPVTEYDDMGVFCVNGNDKIAQLIVDDTPFRGMVLTGGVQDTANEMLYVVSGLADGSLEPGFIKNAATVFVDDATAEEFLETGTVVSLTDADFE